MAAITSTWDETVPAGADDPKNGDDRIREDKLCVRERARNGGHRMQTSGATIDAKDGRHVCGEEQAAGASGALAGEFYIYDADGATRGVVVRDSTAAAPNQFDVGAKQVKGTGGTAITGAAGLGNTTVTGTLHATGATTLDTTLAVTGVATHSDIVKPNADNTIDLGVDTTNRWRDFFVGRNAKIGGTLAVTGVATFTAAPSFTGGITVVGTLTTQGGQLSNSTPVNTGTYSILSTDRIITCALTGNVTLNLPASGSSAGRELWIAVQSDAGGTHTITLHRNGADTIDATAGDFTMNPNSGTGTRGVHIVCVGTDWVILTARRSS